MKSTMVAFIGIIGIRYSDIREKFNTVKEICPNATWISSGMVGAPLIAAKYAMLNKIPLQMHLPFPPEMMNTNCAKGWKNILNDVLNYAQKISINSDTFTSSGYQKCNQQIIDKANVVIVFNLFSGDNSIWYAKSSGKLVLNGFSLSAPITVQNSLWAYPVTGITRYESLEDENTCYDDILNITWSWQND